MSFLLNWREHQLLRQATGGHSLRDAPGVAPGIARRDAGRDARGNASPNADGWPTAIGTYLQTTPTESFNFDFNVRRAFCKRHRLD